MGNNLLPNIKWNAPPRSPGGSLVHLGVHLNRGGLGRPPLVAFAWGKVVCLGADGKRKVGVGVFFFPSGKW